MISLPSDIDVEAEFEADRKRVVALIDLDCFYAQVEAKRAGIPSEMPLVVQQWSAVIAVSYSAREYGIKRGVDSIDDCKKKCPQLVCCHVDCVDATGRIIRGKNSKWFRDNCKVTLALFRAESDKILQIFRRHCALVERASIDEAYLDLTAECESRLSQLTAPLPNDEWNGFLVSSVQTDDDQIAYVSKPETKTKTKISTDIEETKMSAEQLHSASCVSTSRCEERSHDTTQVHKLSGELMSLDFADRMLQMGAVIVDEIRGAVKRELGYTSSAGVSHNKKFAKLMAGRNKPDGQTLLRSSAVPCVLHNTAIDKLQGFGGKMGRRLKESYGVESLADVYTQLSLAELRTAFGSMADEMWRWCHGVDNEPVKAVEKVKRLGSSKNVAGVRGKEEVMRHLRVICSELAVRMAADRKQWSRVPTTLTASYQLQHAHRKVCTGVAMPYIPPLSTDSDSDTQSWHSRVVESMLKALSESLFPFDKGYTFVNIGLTAAGFVETQRSNLLSFLGADSKKKAATGNCEEIPTVSDGTAVGSAHLRILRQFAHYTTDSHKSAQRSKPRGLDAFLSKDSAQIAKSMLSEAKTEDCMREKQSAKKSGIKREKRKLKECSECSVSPASSDMFACRKRRKVSAMQSVETCFEANCCVECGARFDESATAPMRSWKQQHFDMHLAQRLSLDLNGSGLSALPKSNESTVKKKSKTHRKAKSETNVEMRKITCFFKKK